MTAPQFVDTNLLLYAFDRTAPAKQARAREWVDHLWRTRDGRLSYQILSEFYSVALRKHHLSVATARTVIEGLLEWHPASPSPSHLMGAWQLQDRYGLSWWDALVVASARDLRCGFLLTEDLQEGQTLDGVVVVNPFRTVPSDLR